MKRSHRPEWVFPAVVMAFLFVSLNIQAFAQWTNLNGPNKPRNVRDAAVSSDGSTAYVADETFLYKTTNGGTSWAKTSSTISSPLLVTTRPDSSSFVVAATALGYTKSTDGGSSWTPTSLNGQIQRLSTSNVNSQYMYIGKRYYSGTKSVYYSSDGGRNWNPASSCPFATDITDIAPFPGSSRGDRVWAVGSDGNTEGTADTTTASTRGVFYSADKGVTWSANHLGGYNLTAIAIRDRGASPDEYLFAGSASGKLYFSANAGATWAQQTAYASASGATAVHAIKVRTDATIMYVASDKGIHKSTDDGSSWTSISSGMKYKNVLALAIKPNDQTTMFATTDREVYKTTNGGASWSVVDAGMGIMNASNVIGTFAGSGLPAWAVSKEYSTIAQYNDGAGTWANYDLGAADSVFSGENVYVRSNGDVFAFGSQADAATIYRKQNDSTIFRKISMGADSACLSGNTIKGVAIDPKDNTWMYAFGRGSTTGSLTRNLYISTNSGASFSVLARVGPGSGDAAVVNALVVDPVGAGSHSQVMHAAVVGAGIWKTTNGGSSWSRSDPGNVGTEVSMAADPNTPNIVYAGGIDGLWKTTDAGAHWYVKKSDSVKSVILSPTYTNSANYVVILTNSNVIRYSNDGGSTWINAASDISGTASSLSATPNGVSTAAIFAPTPNGVYSLLAPASVPTDNTSYTNPYINLLLSWSTPTRAMSYELWVDPSDDFGDPIIHSSNYTGTTFRNFNLAPSTTYYWRVAAINPVGETAYQGTTSSFTTTTTGSFTMNNLSSSGHPKPSWTPTGQVGGSPVIYNVYHYPCTYGAGDCNAPGVLIAQTSDTYYVDDGVTIAGKWDTKTTTHYYYVTASSVSTKVNYDSAEGGMEDKTTVGTALPKVTQLNPSYPNPFNPATTISYDLSKDGFVTVKVYNILGQEVATLVNGEEKAGTRSVQFDGTRLGSGVYFCTMQAPGYSKMMKLMLVK